MSDKMPDRTPPLTAEQLRSVDANAAALRFNRKRSTGDRVRAQARLHETLVGDAQLYDGSLQDQRDAVAHAIQAVISYLTDHGFAGATLEPLNRPVLALIERESNRLDPLFVERARNGAPSRSFASDHQAGALSALADAWLKLHPAPDPKTEIKLRALARELSGAYFGKVTYSLIKRARELTAQEGAEHMAVRWAKFYREQLAEASHELGSQNAFMIVLRNLNRTAGPPERKDWRT